MLSPVFTDEVANPKRSPGAVLGEQRRKVMYFVSDLSSMVHLFNLVLLAGGGKWYS